MKRFFVLALVPTMAWASDHNNVEAGRPLEFDDAYSIGFRERSFGIGFSWKRAEARLKTEFKYGFAKNQDLAIGFLSPGSFEAAYFYGFQRETDTSPGLAIRLDGHYEHSEWSGRARGIVTRSLGQFDKVHLNVDLDTDGAVGATLGYSTPLGYPRRFDQTLVASLGYASGTLIGGLGLRHQLDPRSVFDVGVTTEFRLAVGYSVSF